MLLLLLETLGDDDELLLLLALLDCDDAEMLELVDELLEDADEAVEAVDVDGELLDGELLERLDPLDVVSDDDRLLLLGLDSDDAETVELVDAELLDGVLLDGVLLLAVVSVEERLLLLAEEALDPLRVLDDDDDGLLCEDTLLAEVVDALELLGVLLLGLELLAVVSVDERLELLAEEALDPLRVLDDDDDGLLCEDTLLAEAELADREDADDADSSPAIVELLLV